MEEEKDLSQQLKDLFYKLKEKGLFKHFDTYEQWEKAQEEKKQDRYKPK